MRCPSCRIDLPADSRFCSQCGRSVAASAEVAEKLAEVMSELRGEERLVTVVFADLTGSVQRTAHLSPEDAANLVNPLLEAMVELMVRHGGRIDRFLGDGVLAVFGVPVAHEDDPIRAVTAAFELRERSETLGLEVTVGVNTGRVYFGPVGSDLHKELTVMGPTVNLAARLQSAAGSGEILVGEATHGHVHRAFHLEPTSLAIKGLTAPVTAYRAHYELDHPDKVRGIAGLTSSLVGRDEEIGRLAESLDGRSHTVALVGPAGVGKSRLAAEFSRLAAERGVTWMEGRCLELTRHLPYAPIIDLLRRRYGRDRTGEAVVSALHEMVEEGVLDRRRTEAMAPFLAHLFSDTTGEADRQVTGADADQRRRLTIAAMVDYFLAMARRGPVVVFLEDLHWGDEASLDLVVRLHEASFGVPLVLALAFRDDQDYPTADLNDRMNSILLPIEALTTEESRTLVRELLDRSGIPESLEKQIVVNAAGSPFYAEEIIRTLIQRGVLVRRDGHWETVEGLDDVPLPESVEGLIMSRFDRLSPALKRTARVASVVGEGFTESLLEAVGGVQAKEQLPALVEAGLCTVHRSGTSAEYGFIHALTRQAIYASLLPSHRRELHGRVAAALEQSGSVELDLLAHHYEASADHARAVEYVLAAAEEAMEAFANDTAFHHLETGLSRIDQLPEAERKPWRARYRARIGELLERQAEHEKARVELTAALDDLDDDPLVEARLWRLIGQTRRLQDEYDHAHDAYDRAEAALERVPDSSERHRSWIEVQQERAFALYFGGRGRELPDHNQRMAPVVERHGTVAQQVDLRRAMALDGFVRRRFALDREAVDLSRAALDLAASGADPGRVAEMTFVLGFTLLWADQVDEAAAILEQAVAAARLVGDVVHENRATSYRAVALRRAGRIDDAAAAARESLDLSVRLSDDYYRGHDLATLGWVGWKRGDGTWRRCEEAYAAWGEADEGGGYNTEFVWMAVWPLAAAAHESGDFEEAVGHLRHLRVPWERPMAPELEAAVDAALSKGEPHIIGRALDLARRLRLL